MHWEQLLSCPPMDPRVHLSTRKRNVLTILAVADQALKRGLNVCYRRRFRTKCKQFEWFVNFAAYSYQLIFDERVRNSPIPACVHQAERLDQFAQEIWVSIEGVKQCTAKDPAPDLLPVAAPCIRHALEHLPQLADGGNSQNFLPYMFVDTPPLLALPIVEDRAIPLPAVGAGIEQAHEEDL